MLAAMIMGAAAAAGSQEERQPASGDGLGPDWRGTAGHSEMWAGGGGRGTGSPGRARGGFSWRRDPDE